MTDSAAKDIPQGKLDAIGKKVRAQLETMLQLARDAGVKRPVLYIESEGGIYVMDKDHPAYESEGAVHQHAVVCSVFFALPFGTDVGAW